MKKSRLAISVNYDFDLIGITTTMKEYKLAWCINEATDCNFEKADDIKIDFVNLKNITISNFIFETEHIIFHLLKNRLVFNNALCDQFLIPELKSIDYFVKVDGQRDLYPTKAVISSLKELDQIQYITTIDPQNLKQKENLIF